MKELSYAEVGAELQVHPYHVRRIIRDKRYSAIITPIVRGYNRITFRFDQVQRLKRQRQREALKSLRHVRALRQANGKAAR